MGESAQIAFISVVGLYKLVSLATGTCLAYMGYRLFMAGIWGRAGDVDVEFREYKLLMRKAAPGTFFTVAGTIVITLTLFKGLGYEIEQKAQRVQPGLSMERPMLPELPPPTKK